MRGFFQRLGAIARRAPVKSLWNALPGLLFGAGIATVIFGYGLGVGFYRWFPFDELRAARITAQILRNQAFPVEGGKYKAFIGETDIPTSEIAGRTFHRFIADSGNENLILSGVKNQYREHCPDAGCLAVELRRDGSLVRAWPFLPDALLKAKTDAAPYEEIAFSPRENIYANGLRTLPNGDLIVVFFAINGFPTGGGVARVRPDGSFVWYRRDYGHHWPAVTNDEVIYPAARILNRPTHIEVDGVGVVDLACRDAYIADTIRIVNLGGRLKKEISVFDALRRSPWRAAFIHAINECDPLHVNFVVEVGPELAAQLPGVRPNDLLVSMRHISAIGIIGRDRGEMKRLFRGSFLLQHSVQPLAGSTVIMLDNGGAATAGGPSRLLTLDLATGEERTIAPRMDDAPRSLFTIHSGNVSLSRDHRRALVAITTQGLSYEIRLSDGATLTRIESLGDTSSLPGFSKPGRAGRFQTFGVYYAQ